MPDESTRWLAGFFVVASGVVIALVNSVGADHGEKRRVYRSIALFLVYGLSTFGAAAWLFGHAQRSNEVPKLASDVTSNRPASDKENGEFNGAHIALKPTGTGPLTFPSLKEIYDAYNESPIGTRDVIQKSFIGSAVDWTATIFDTPTQNGQRWLQISCEGANGIAFIPWEQAGAAINRAKPTAKLRVRGTITAFTEQGNAPIITDAQVEVIK